MVEEWKGAPSLPEYEVSSFGRIRRIPYEAPMPRGGTRVYGGKAHRGQWDHKSKRRIFVFKDRTYKVHQLVCVAFNGPKPFPEAIVMHNDEDGDNNVPSNLKWGTQKENLNYPGFRDYAKRTCRSKMSSTPF